VTVNGPEDERLNHEPGGDDRVRDRAQPPRTGALFEVLRELDQEGFAPLREPDLRERRVFDRAAVTSLMPVLFRAMAS
jgi:hypothetical protein